MSRARDASQDRLEHRERVALAVGVAGVAAGHAGHIPGGAGSMERANSASSSGDSRVGARVDQVARPARCAAPGPPRARASQPSRSLPRSTARSAIVIATFSATRGVESWWWASTSRISRIQPCSPCSAAWRLHSGETCGSQPLDAARPTPRARSYAREEVGLLGLELVLGDEALVAQAAEVADQSRRRSARGWRGARGARVADEAGEVLAGLAGQLRRLVDRALRARRPPRAPPGASAPVDRS